MFAAFSRFSLLVVAQFAIHGALDNTSNAAPAINFQSRCPNSKCLTDAISCLAGETSDDSGNSGQASKLAKLEKEVASLKAELAKVGKPSGFVMLDSNGRLPQKLLVAGYDKYSAYDLAWHSLYMAAAAACRGSSSSRERLPGNNAVMARNTADKKTCGQICAQTAFSNCDAEVSIYGRNGKARQNGEIVGAFYNYPCGHSVTEGSKATVANEDIMDHSGRNPYFSFCCCR